MNSIAFDTKSKRILQKLDKNSIAFARKSVAFGKKSTKVDTKSN